MEYLVLERRSPDSPWKVVLATGIWGRTKDDVIRLDVPIVDSAGYNVVPTPSRIAPGEALAAPARYWQSWHETGAPPLAGPEFEDEYWTTELGQKLANRQGKRAPNGLVAHTTFHDDVPAEHLWSFGVNRSARLECSAMRQTVIWEGGAHQDSNRQKWGADLAPGVHSRVVGDGLLSPCAQVSSTPAPLFVFGGDITFVSTRGDQEEGTSATG